MNNQLLNTLKYDNKKFNNDHGINVDLPSFYRGGMVIIKEDPITMQTEYVLTEKGKAYIKSKKVENGQN